jgi:hypothetical protein
MHYAPIQASYNYDSAIISDSLIAIATNYYGKDPIYAWFSRVHCANNRGNTREQVDALLKDEEYAQQSQKYKFLGSCVVCDTLCSRL